MRHLLLVPSLLLCLPVGTALADNTVRHVATSAGISASPYSTFKDDKRIIPAQDELSAFVASDGAIRGAYVESALQQVRQSNPGLQASDADLAKAILAHDESVASR